MAEQSKGKRFASPLAKMEDDVEDLVLVYGTIMDTSRKSEAKINELSERLAEECGIDTIDVTDEKRPNVKSAMFAMAYTGFNMPLDDLFHMYTHQPLPKIDMESVPPRYIDGEFEEFETEEEDDGDAENQDMENQTAYIDADGKVVTNVSKLCDRLRWAVGLQTMGHKKWLSAEILPPIPRQVFEAEDEDEEEEEDGDEDGGDEEYASDEDLA